MNPAAQAVVPACQKVQKPVSDFVPLSQTHAAKKVKKKKPTAGEKENNVAQASQSLYVPRFCGNNSQSSSKKMKQ